MSATAWTCPLYHVDFVAIVCREAQLPAELTAILPAGLPASYTDDLLEHAKSAAGLCMDFERPGSAPRPLLTLWVEQHPWPRFAEYAAHETLHATERVLGRVGLTLNAETAEAFTYYQGHLLRKVMALKVAK